MTVPDVVGWSHVALSVTDLRRSADWYGEVLGFAPLWGFETDDFRRQLLRHPSGVVLGLTQHHTTPTSDTFTPNRVGLDHLSLRPSDPEQLRVWVQHLDALGIAHGGVQEGGVSGTAFVAVHDPDGIQVELYVVAEEPGG